MKYVIALCLLLAIGCSAFPTKDIDFQPFLKLQQKVMGSLLSAHSGTDDPNLVESCFNQYITDQQSVMVNYNKVYTVCVTRAQTEKNDLTAQSAEMRKDLLARSDGMCNSLYSCDTLVDGLEFFDCYRNSSADSYKVMFTLNSDANSQFNTISTKYSIIDANLTDCVDEARLNYARELEKCDSDFNICIGGGQPTTVIPIDTTTEQTTVEPIVSTQEPVVSTEKPETEPTTAAPVVSTDKPIDSTTDVPIVSTDKPAPEPTTVEPIVSTQEPVVSTEKPETEPTTAAPAVSTDKPIDSTTDVPIVSTDKPAPEPTTVEPIVSTQEPVVSTEQPETEPTTVAPVVSTDKPAPEPTTVVPTEEPTPEPTTVGPVVTTEEPELTTEKSPEEDIAKMLPETFRGALDRLKRFF